MHTDQSREDGSRDIIFRRRRLFERMMAAKESGDRQEMLDALAEAKLWLKSNHARDTPIRDAQRQLLIKAFH